MDHWMSKCKNIITANPFQKQEHSGSQRSIIMVMPYPVVKVCHLDLVPEKIVVSPTILYIYSDDCKTQDHLS